MFDAGLEDAGEIRESSMKADKAPSRIVVHVPMKFTIGDGTLRLKTIGRE